MSGCSIKLLVTKDRIKELKSIASDIQSAAGEVPFYARKGNLSGEASSMKRTLGKGSYDEVDARLKSCQEKACSVIPEYDSTYAKQMESVTDAARKIRGVIEELREFMLENPLTIDAGEFKRMLEAKETKWKRELREVKESLDETVANAKGAQRSASYKAKTR